MPLRPIRRRAMLSFAFACLVFIACETQAAPPVPAALGPESRAGNVEPAPDYEAALTTLLQKVVTDEGLVRYDLLRSTLNLASEEPRRRGHERAAQLSPTCRRGSSRSGWNAFRSARPS